MDVDEDIDTEGANKIWTVDEVYQALKDGKLPAKISNCIGCEGKNKKGYDDPTGAFWCNNCWKKWVDAEDFSEIELDIEEEFTIETEEKTWLKLDVYLGLKHRSLPSKISNCFDCEEKYKKGFVDNFGIFRCNDCWRVWIKTAGYNELEFD